MGLAALHSAGPGRWCFPAESFRWNVSEQTCGWVPGPPLTTLATLSQDSGTLGHFPYLCCAGGGGEGGRCRHAASSVLGWPPAGEWGGDRGSSEATSQGNAVAPNGPAPFQLSTLLIKSQCDPVAGKRESPRPWAEHPAAICLRMLAHGEGPSGVVACAGSGSLFPCSWACVPTRSPAAS